MQYARLGTSGLQVSAVGLGTNNFGPRMDLDRTRAVLDRALDLGVTFIDTADIYGRGQSEDFIGQCLQGAKRQQVVLATKFSIPMGEGPYHRGGSRRYIFEAVEASLRRLRTDVIDLYQMHRPDENTPILETLQALDDLVRQGKVRYVGTSNYAGWQIVDAQWTARTEHLVRPVSAQHEFSLLNREIEQEVLPAAGAMGLGVIPYFPLASGFLTGKYRKGQLPEGARLTNQPARFGNLLSDENFERLERLEAFAQDRGHSMLELAFGWLLSHAPVSTVIAGATSPEQVEANVNASEWRLTRDEMEQVAGLL